MGEVLKVCVSAYLTVKETESEVPEAGYKRLIWLSFNSKKVIVLVLLYTTSNMLTYYALARVEAAVYTVLQQLKIFSTAIFSVLLLGKALTGTQWRALALLVVGCILVASPHISAPAKAASRRFLAYSTTDATSQNTEESLSGVFLGICAVIVMVIMSGFSATYFEGILKTGGKHFVKSSQTEINMVFMLWSFNI
jgi:UDP-sugar transporter A1/2/3